MSCRAISIRPSCSTHCTCTCLQRLMIVLTCAVYFDVLYCDRLMADTMQYPRGSLFAFGIDENTALVVTGPWAGQSQGQGLGQGGHRTGEVLGESGVTLFDMTRAEVEGGEEGGEWRATGVRVSHLTRGDVVDLQSYQVTPAPFKTPLAVSAAVKWQGDR